MDDKIVSLSFISFQIEKVTFRESCITLQQEKGHLLLLSNRAYVGKRG